jgi:hypothetical protein
MRLWSLHPRYLDPPGLVALWREALLAQAVLAGRTRGYRHHPQLARFAAQPEPAATIGAYLTLVHAESLTRGYRFDAARIDRPGTLAPLSVRRGQLAFEWSHLQAKLALRSPAHALLWQGLEQPEPHPLFVVRAGAVEPWERP